MTERTIQIKITSDGRAFVVDQAANAQAVRKLGDASDAAGKQVDTLSAKVIKAGKDSTAATAGIEDSQRRLGTAVKSAGQQVAQQSAPIKQLGNDAAVTAQQLRQVGPQFTDIVTQLAAGQNPLQIAIQQGGQLKDVFGGIGPAARALGGYVLGMINPLTLAGGALLAFAVGAAKGASESEALNRGMILSGNSAGLTASRYYEMAAGVSAIAGTKGAAIDTLQQLAQEGHVAAENLVRFATIAQQLDQLVGQPVATTAKQFASLAEQPVEASLKLNQTYNYLTASVYQQIKALEDQGKHVEAVKLAQEEMANGLAARMPQLESNLGFLERLWLNIKGAAKGAVDGMLEVGRATTLRQQIAGLEGQLNRAEGNDANFRHAALGEDRSEAAKQSLRDQIASLKEVERLQVRSAGADADRLRQTEARGRFEKIVESSLSKQEQLSREITRITNEGKAAGASQKEIYDAIAAAKKRIVDTDAEAAKQDTLSAQITAIRRSVEVEAVRSKELIKSLGDARKLGAVSEVEYIEKVGRAEVTQLALEESNLVQELASARQKKNSRQEVADLEGRLAVLREQRLLREGQIERDLTNNRIALQRAAAAFYESERQQFEGDLGNEGVSASKRFEAAQQAVDEYVRSVREANDEVDFQATLVGKTVEEQARLNELRRIQLRLAQELLEIEKRSAGGNLTAEQRAELEGKARQAAAEASAKVETKLWTETWRHANGEVAESFYDALTGRGVQARDRIKSMFEQLVLRPLLMPVAQGFSNAVTGAIGGALGGGGGAGGLLSSIGSNVASSYIGQQLGLPSMGSMLSSGASTVAGWLGIGGASAAAASGLGLTAGIGAGTTLAAAGTGGLGLSAGLIGSTSGGLGLTAGSIGASSIGAGLGTSAAVTGGAGAAAGGAGAMSALAAIPGWGWAAMAVLAASQMFKGGETRSGGQYVGTAFEQGPSGGQINASGVAQAISGTQLSINSAIAAMGGTATVGQLFSGLESSKNGKGFAYAGGTLSTGAAFGQGSHSYMNRRGSKSEEQAFSEFTEELKQATLQALQASDIKGALADWIRSLGNIDALGGAGLDAVYNRVQAALTERAALQQKLNEITLSTVSAEQQLAKAREAERAQIDATNQDILDQVYATQDLNSAAVALSQAYEREKGGVESAIEAHRNYARELRNFRDHLFLGAQSSLSAEMQRGLAQKIFETTAAGARGGDANAQSQLQGAAGDYVTALMASVGSRAEYSIELSRVAATLSDTATASDAQATAQQQQLDTMVQQLTELHLLNENVLTFAQAMAAYTAAQAKLDQVKVANAAAAAISAVAPAAYTGASTAPATAVDDYQWFNPDMASSGFASGGAFMGGGIVMRPTMFNVSEMAEDGAEAIMPLTNVGGKLGVRAAGGGGAGMEALLRTLLEEMRSSRDDTRRNYAEQIVRLQNLDGRFKKWDTDGMPAVRVIA